MISSDTASRKELVAMQMQADRIMDEGLESTRRMVGLVDESQDAGTRTLGMLDEQGGQLNRVEKNLDKINKDVREAEKDLTTLEKCCGLCVCPCNQAKRHEKGDAYYNENYPTATAENVVTKQPSPNKQSPQAGKAGGYITRIANDAREDEMDENLMHVGTVVDTLKNMAMDMGGEISKQNVQMDRINLKAGSNTQRVDDANVRAAKILRKK